MLWSSINFVIPLLLSFNSLNDELRRILWMEHFVGILTFLSNKRLLSPNYTLEWKIQKNKTPFFQPTPSFHTPPPRQRMAIYLAKQKVIYTFFLILLYSAKPLRHYGVNPS